MLLRNFAAYDVIFMTLLVYYFRFSRHSWRDILQVDIFTTHFCEIYFNIILTLHLYVSKGLSLFHTHFLLHILVSK
jgi:hypothetical protein